MKEKFSRVFGTTKRSIVNSFKEHPIANCFLLTVGGSLIIYAILSFIFGHSFMMGLFFAEGRDMFMDFFNSVRDVSTRLGVYEDRHVIYPPMANIFFDICRRLMPAEYASTGFDDRYTWVNYPSNIVVCIVFLLIPTVLLGILISKNLHYKGKMRPWILLFMLFNTPMLYLLERGNILIYAILGISVYIFTFNSESKFKREIGLISLAFAFSLKLYPALFGYMLIAEKRWKEAIRCIIYALILLILPSVFYGGPSCFLIIYRNITSFSSSSASTMDIVFDTLHIPHGLGKALYGTIMAIVFACWLVMPFIVKNQRCFFLFTALIICALPSTFSVYAFPMFLPIIVLYLNFEQETGENKLSFSLDKLALIIVLFLFLFVRIKTKTDVVFYVLIVIATVVLCVENIIAGVKLIKNRNAQKL